MNATTTDGTEVILPFEGRRQSLGYQKQMKQKSFYRLREVVTCLLTNKAKCDQ